MRCGPDYLSVMPTESLSSTPPAQSLIRQLRDLGMSVEAIAERMGTGVTPRSVYRWAEGKHAPQRPADLLALRRLVSCTCVTEPEAGTGAEAEAVPGT